MTWKQIEWNLPPTFNATLPAPSDARQPGVHGAVKGQQGAVIPDNKTAQNSDISAPN
jgi:hypothetical protein